MTNVTSQGEKSDVKPTLVNVTIRGFLDNLIVNNTPVNFTIDPGIAPGTAERPKQNEPYLNVTIGSNNNVRWNITINGTDMNDSYGNLIPVNNIKINYTCFDETTTERPSLMNLSYDLQWLCGRDLAYNAYVLIYFFLDVPNGQYNNTYNGDLWINANSSKAREGHNETTWYGPSNTTVTIKKRVDIKWTLTPINFGEVNPGTKVNATKDQGWPTNITIGSATNIPVDLYINGTNLTNIINGNIIDSHYITYSNATSENDWPFQHVHLLNNTLPDSSTEGDFANWGNISRGRDIFSYWEMDVPNVPGGYYSGDVVAKAVDAGNDPTIV